jgi:uncharacterized protein YdaU (DUF1376 family)
VNYFEMHIGDYSAATAHLSLVEDGIYFRLLRRYYMQEGPLLADKVVIARQVGARSPADLKALDAVLAEFFVLEPDGYHQKRADEAIALYLEKQDESGEKREHEAERKRRYRERRGDLFDALRAIGIVPPFDTPTDKLVHLLSHGTGRGQDAEGTANQSQSQSPNPVIKKQGRCAPLVLPDWLSADVWQLWHDYRNSRKGWTQHARKLSLGSLTTLHAEGHDAQAVIERSIEMGWTGLFPVPPKATARAGPSNSAPGKTMQALQALEEMKNGLAANRDSDRLPETALLGFGPDPGE